MLVKHVIDRTASAFSADMALFRAPEERFAILPPGPPILIVSVDTEAEFDWNGPFLRAHTKVRNLPNQRMAQEIFDRYGVRPVYLVDYAVASQPAGYGPLQEFVRSDRCEVGAHLHPWITPPFAEELGEKTSFSHNLPALVQRAKLERLTEAIKKNFGISPVSYRAGRYGVGEEIGEILGSLGYQIDMSAQPGIDMRRIHGPDFRRVPERPYWFGRGCSLLEIPATAAFTGIIANRALPNALGVQLYDLISRPSLNKLRSLGIFARLGLLERLCLTPEGVTMTELRRLTNYLLSLGNRVFVFSYHSSSLLPGNTEYVRSASDLSEFLQRISEYAEFFMQELGGISMTPAELRATLLREGTSAVANGRDT